MVALKSVYIDTDIPMSAGRGVLMTFPLILALETECQGSK